MCLEAALWELNNERGAAKRSPENFRTTTEVTAFEGGSLHVPVKWLYG
jgi:hypothetical protein